MKRVNVHTLLREPLLHFLLIGAGLFFLFDQIGGEETEPDNRIVITQSDLDRLAAVWLRRTGRPPSGPEREQQLNHYIREQILYREAVALGLDQNDVIVRRRMAQKMEYLFTDLSLIPEPTEPELIAFLSEHPSIFTVPAKISFRHIYLDSNNRGEAVDEEAKQLLVELQDLDGSADVTDKGDRFLLPYEYYEQRERELANLFGESFAIALFALPVGGWKGPIPSEYGSHLVQVQARIEEQLPPLAEIRQRVSDEWRAAKEREANDAFYQSLVQRYQVVITDVVGGNTFTSAQ